MSTSVPPNVCRRFAASVVVLGVLLIPSLVGTAGGPGGGKGGGGGGNSAPSYQIYRLNMSDGVGGPIHGQAKDINASRLVVGHVNFADEAYKATSWTVSITANGVESHLNLLDDTGFELGNSVADGCNDGGEIVGEVGDPDDTFYGPAYWASSSDVVEILPSSGIGQALAINNQSIITGFSAGKALVWSRVDGQWQSLELAALGNPGSDDMGNALPDQCFGLDLTDIDENSQSVIVVGRSNENAAKWQVFVNPQTNALTAGPAMILPAIGLAEARAVNSAGTIAGWAQIGFSSGGDGVVWIDGQPQLLALTEPLPFSNSPPLQSWPNDINKNDLLVGDDFYRAVMWVDKNASTTIVLDDYLSKGKNAPFTSLATAYAANGNDEIVGFGWYKPDNLYLPFLAIPSLK